MITNMQNGKVTISPTQTPKDYRLDEFGQFRIEHYEQKPAFAGFLPGIGGPDGVPLWCLYVNRAQAV